MRGMGAGAVSGVKRRMAEVLREHRQLDEYGYSVDECSCGWSQCDDDDDCYWREHIASVLVAELGLERV
ncbi:hypothetical protein ACAG26_24220 [Mycobacterium sp. pUA109]|uniref:hypothetical protein n=1 Tax=Mycobacterium sp. pUA109 TaxID=3238982 RepID=UPI00351B85AC